MMAIDPVSKNTELWSPAAEDWTAVGKLLHDHEEGAFAAMGHSGRVIAVGGVNSKNVTEVFTDGNWTLAAESPVRVDNNPAIVSTSSTEIVSPQNENNCSMRK